MSAPVYDAYCDTGVEWLGAVPSHWKVARLNALFREISEPGSDGLPVLSVSIHSGVSDTELADDEMDRVVARSEDRSKYKRVEPNDLVYNMMRAWQGGFGAVQTVGSVSPAYVVARPTSSQSTKFVERLLRTPNAVGEMKRLSKGVTDFRLRLYWDEFKNIKVALPSLDEQIDIDAFLDREIGKIDALVDAQTRLIELLKEKRQAFIAHAVTKGLDPAAPMKDSGVEWMGQVPAHWEVRPLKYLVSLRSGGTPSKDNPDLWGGDVPWASAKDLKAETLTGTIDHLTEQAVASGAASLVQPGAVVVLVRGMMLARTFPVCEVAVPLAINQDLKALLPRNGLDGSFLAWALRGTEAETLNRLDEAGHGTKALRMETWLSLPIPVPPMDEQRKISEELVKALAKLAGLTEQAQAAIALLQERRAGLISAAVTGKIDVRGRAAEQAEAA